MTNPSQQPVPQQQPHGYAPTGRPPRRPQGVTVTGVIGLVLGVIALILSFIPIINNVAIIFALVGLLLAIIGIVGTARGKKTGKAAAIVAAVLSALALVVSFSMQAATGKAFDDAFGTASSEQPSDSPAGSQQQNKTGANSNAEKAKVEFRATATGKGSVTWGEAGSTNQEQFTDTWNKTITGEEAKKGYTLTVTGDIMGGDSQKVSCTVLVNGQQKSHKTGSGSAGSALCDTSGLF